MRPPWPRRCPAPRLALATAAPLGPVSPAASDRRLPPGHPSAPYGLFVAAARRHVARVEVCRPVLRFFFQRSAGFAAWVRPLPVSLGSGPCASAPRPCEDWPLLGLVSADTVSPVCLREDLLPVLWGSGREAFVEAAGSLAGARRLLSALRSIAVLPGALTPAAGLAPYPHRGCELAARALARSPALVGLRFLVARVSARAASLPSNLLPSRATSATAPSGAWPSS